MDKSNIGLEEQTVVSSQREAASMDDFSRTFDFMRAPLLHGSTIYDFSSMLYINSSQPSRSL